MTEDGIAPERWNDLAAISDQGSMNDQKGRICFGRRFGLSVAALRRRVRECLIAILRSFHRKGKGTKTQSF
jgi:hypothetical protein